jgi:hypothetical protein
MAKALDEQRASAVADSLSFEERLGLLVDREADERDARRLVTRLKFASLRQASCVEDLDLCTPGGLDRAVVAHLVDGAWIGRAENLLITGETGLGTSWIACAIALPPSTTGDSPRSHPLNAATCSRFSKIDTVRHDLKRVPAITCNGPSSVECPSWARLARRGLTAARSVSLTRSCPLRRGICVTLAMSLTRPTCKPQATPCSHFWGFLDF